MNISEKKTLELIIEKLRSGSDPEKIEAANALGNSGDMSVIPALRRALKRLKQLEPYTKDNLADESDLVYDPDAGLRVALLNAITKLLLGKENGYDSENLKLQQVTVQSATLTDGSQIKIIIKASKDIENSLAHTIYTKRFIPLLKELETIE